MIRRRLAFCPVVRTGFFVKRLEVAFTFCFAIPEIELNAFSRQIKSEFGRVRDLYSACDTGKFLKELSECLAEVLRL